MHSFSKFVTIGFALTASTSVYAAANESQTKANELLSSTFVASGTNLFAALKNGDQWTLVELRNARPSLSSRPVPETDRLNGVTDRFSVYVTCDQHRTRNGNWSEWVKGTPGASGQIAVAMTGGLMAYWSANGEKKNGVWSFRTGLGSKELSNDPALIRALINDPNRDMVAAPRRDLTLAETKQAAEAGDAEAQYRFAKTYGSGAEWNRWIAAAAAQGYGPAEDDLAWTTNWARFSTAANPAFVESILRSHGAEMRRALVLASSAADKGFPRSRQLLAMAYENGVLVQRDPVEAYKWYRLIKDAEKYPSNQSPNDALVKKMSMAQVQAGEDRAANYRPGGTPIQIRNALIIPNLKLSGLASNGDNHIAIVNGKRLVAGQRAELNVAGIPVNAECVSVDAKCVTLRLHPEPGHIILKTGSAPVLVP